MIKQFSKNHIKQIFLQGYSLVEAAISLAVIGLIAGAFFDVNNFKSEVENIKSIKRQLETIEQSIDIYMAKNGNLPCPASRIDQRDTANFGVSTDCTAVAPSGTVETGSGANIVRLGVLPVRSLDLPDAMMFDPWGNKISYSVVRGMAQNRTNYDNYSTASADVIRINDVNGNRVNRVNSVGDENVVSWVVVSHGKDGRGGYNMGGIQKPCRAALDQENCDDDNVFIDSAYNPSPANAFDDYIIWKTKSQQTFDKYVVITPGSNSTPAQCEEIFDVSEFKPSDLDGLRLWLDAKDSSTIFKNTSCTTPVTNGSDIYCWKDKSGNGYAAVNLSGNNSKVPNWYEGPDNLSYVKFTRDYLGILGGTNGAIFPSNYTVSAMDMFVVSQTYGASNGFLLNFYPKYSMIFIPSYASFIFWSFNGKWLYANSPSDNNNHIWNCFAEYKDDGSSTKCWKDDQVIVSGRGIRSAASFGTQNFFIGCESQNRIYCHSNYLQEILIFDNKLSDDDREKVKAYLKKKWDL